jgi:adenosylcobinamide kinase/adenosylcobinamide-phosphate guanylyltransferase
VSLTVLAAGPEAYAVLLDELLLDCGAGVPARSHFGGPPLSQVATVLLTADDPAVRDPSIAATAGKPGQVVHGRRWRAESHDAGGGRLGWLVEHTVEGLLLHCPRGQVRIDAPYALTVPNPALRPARPLRTNRRVLVTGGARSGKSAHAEGLVGGAAVYVATGYVPSPDDPAWAGRVAAHQARRPAAWQTHETLDVAGLLAADGPALLVDGLGTWLARTLDEADGWAGAPPRQLLEALSAAVAITPRDVVLVTDEVGDGVVPATASGGLFRDLLGELNAAVAAEVDEVWRVTLGIPQRLR